MMMAVAAGMSVLLVWSGCEGEDEPIPAYLYINEFEMQPSNAGPVGSLSSKITEAMVFLIDQNNLNAPHALGTVSLPATVPVRVSGDFEINIDPVVRASGNSQYLEPYPFYKRFKQLISLAPGADVEVSPVTSYVPDAKFLLIEDFEGTGHLFQTDRDNNPATFIEISDEDVFEGNASGKVRLDTANSVFVAATAQPYEIVFPGARSAFMEVNYKTDIPLEFGVLSVDALNGETPNFEFVVFAKAEWNKIYFDMTRLLSEAPDNRFVFIIRGGIPIENGAFTLNEAYVYLDNIKVITF